MWDWLLSVDMYDLMVKFFWGAIAFFDTKELFSIYNLFIPLLIVSVFLYSDYRKEMGEKAESLHEYLLPKRIWSHKSTQLDMWFYLPIRAMALFMVIPTMSYGLNWVASGMLEVLEAFFGKPPAMQFIPNLWHQAAYTILVFIGIDFGFYYSHMLSHKYPLLWCFHKVHHSAEHLVPFTAHRFHPLDIAWNVSFSIAFSGIIAGICRYSFYDATDPLLLMGNNFVIALSYLTTHNLRHSHIWLHYPTWLDRWLISPARHQIHHSCEARHIDKNFGYLLSCWDRWFQTDYVPKEREEFKVGVHGMPEKGIRSHRSVVSLMVGPIVEAWEIIRKRA